MDNPVGNRDKSRHPWSLYPIKGAGVVVVIMALVIIVLMLSGAH